MSDAFGEPRIEDHPRLGRVLVLDVGEWDSLGSLDPVPHVLRWANARGMICPTYSRDRQKDGSCRYVFTVGAAHHDKEGDSK